MNSAVAPYQPQNSVLRIKVTDTGCGIAPENQHKVFKEIVQFDPNKTQGGGGSGLGLWITRKIIALHGGDVGLSSEGEGSGCCFYIDLPFSCIVEDANRSSSVKSEYMDGVLRNIMESRVQVPSKEDIDVDGHESALSRCSSCADIVQLPHRGNTTACDDVETVSITRGPTGSHEQSVSLGHCAMAGRELRILVVDDSALNRKMTGRALAALGHQSLEADDGTSAIDMYRASVAEGQTFDIIFLDNCMTCMHGPEAAEAIRQLGYRGLILGLTGHTSDEDVRDFTSKGATAVIAKPVNVTSLDRAIKKYLHN
jgi:CheY-like chemotaxis protein